MMRGGGGNGLLLLLAMCLAGATGCYGVSHNPSYFPSPLPFGDVVQTHARPPGLGYYSNFDPRAINLEVRSLGSLSATVSTSGLQAQQVVVATITDANGKPLHRRRVEWLLEGAGQIMEVDESGLFPGRGGLDGPRRAWSYTNCFEHTISRRNGRADEDFVLTKGQSWCVITSAVEGESLLTVYAPEIGNWDARKVVLRHRWVDARCLFPAPQTSRTGVEQILTTSVSRNSDHQPLPNLRVRYRILDGPPAVFVATRTAEAVLPTDADGKAKVVVAQLVPQLGRTRLAVEVQRPPDPNSANTNWVVIEQGEAVIDWEAPAVSLESTLPAKVAVDQDVPCTIAVRNTGGVAAQTLTVVTQLPPEAVEVRADPPAIQEGNKLIWTLTQLEGKSQRNLQLAFRMNRIGPLKAQASVTTGEGQHDEKTLTAEVLAKPRPELKLTVVGQGAGLGVVQEGQPVAGVPAAWQLTIANTGAAPAGNVALKVELDGLEHESGRNPVLMTIGTIPAGESRITNLALIPRRLGRVQAKVTALADEQPPVESDINVAVAEAGLLVKATGPAVRYAGQTVAWDIDVSNPGKIGLTQVVVSSVLPAEVAFKSASDAGRPQGQQVVWTLPELKAGQQKRLQVEVVANQVSPRTVNQVTAQAIASVEDSSGGQSRMVSGTLTSRAEAPLTIQGVPSIKLSVKDLTDPVELGTATTFQITVSNQGSIPDAQVQVVAVLPPELGYKGANGPTAFQVNGQRVTFAPLAALPPGATMIYSVQVEALKVGDARFRAELTSNTLREAVIKEESTNIRPRDHAP